MGGRRAERDDEGPRTGRDRRGESSPPSLHNPVPHDLSWSFSRARKLETCPRAYYYHYYLAHSGWMPTASPEVRRAYVLRKMSDLYLLAGSVVHDVIEEVIRDLASTRTLIPLPLARERARSLLNEAWKESLEGEWRDIPRHRANLLEHYYGIPVRRNDIDRFRRRVFTCLEVFYDSEVLAAIRATPPSEWLAVESMTTFRVDGHKVWARPDIALRRPSGDVHVYDWKTGIAHDYHVDQLTAYAIVAVREWDVEPEQVIVAPVYLRTGEIEKVRLDREAIERAEGMIRRSLREMQERLADPERGIARIEDFPQTDDLSACERCAFLEFCLPELRARHGELPFLEEREEGTAQPPLVGD